MANDVWVYIEHKNGGISPMSLNFLVLENSLQTGFGSNVCAFIIGDKVDDLAKEAFAYGASKVFAVEGDVFKGFRGEKHTRRRQVSFLKRYKPEAALFRGTSQGVDVSAAAAANLGFGLCTDSIGLAIDGGKLKMTRAAFGGNYSVSVVNEKAVPQIATVRPKAFAMPAKDASKAVKLSKSPFHLQKLI